MYILDRVQQLPIDIHTAWEFFSSPKNLKDITPEYMGFDITSSNQDEKMYPGMIIMYTVKPVLNFPVAWVTEITHVQEPYFFVDEQRSGPYKIWHHQHKFKEIPGGVEMQDIVHYDLPFWFLGKFVERVMVRKKLKEIFDYRAKKLEVVFGVIR